MLPRTIANYGGAPQNEEAITDPTSEWDAPFAGRLFEDTAQATRSIGFTWFSFVTTLTAATVTVAAGNVAVAGLFGSGTPQKPTVSKTGTGVYVLTWATEFEDALATLRRAGSVGHRQEAEA